MTVVAVAVAVEATDNNGIEATLDVGAVDTIRRDVIVVVVVFVVAAEDVDGERLSLSNEGAIPNRRFAKSCLCSLDMDGLN